MKLNVLPLLSAIAIAATVSTFAQDAAPAPGGPGGPGGRPNFEQMRQRFEEQIKTSLKATDEEWTALQPLVEKVMTAQRESMSARFGGFGRRGGGPGGDNNGGGNANADRPQRPGQAEAEALRTTLDNPNATPDEIKTKLAAVRAQRQKAESDLAQAREDLKKVLTVRQEAALVSMGILQ